ncbi:hypothetical protein Pcinc_037599 [Petrolisthes cinctipes]|uniref:Uncharacterized protein n=1 Tax=Petrolisthes cinctipes TaxID=88211 RepID=A0AAE1BSC5_PETCI|nr:hypothetical protein Pcinc_037599 [Petrolisthes cinctipes]
MPKRKSKKCGRGEPSNEKMKQQFELSSPTSPKGKKPRVKEHQVTHRARSCMHRVRKRVWPIQFYKTYAVPILFPTPPSPECLPIPEFPDLHQSSPECLPVCPIQLSKTCEVAPSPECLPVSEFPNLHQSRSCQDGVSNILHRQPKNVFQSRISNTGTKQVRVKKVSNIPLHRLSLLLHLSLSQPQFLQAYLDMAIYA